MSADKIQSNQNKKGTPKKCPLYVNAELRSLIGELMKPRVEVLEKIVSTHMVTVPQTFEDNQAGGDWWPDYSVCSHMHYMTEMNGFIHLTQSALKGMSEELEIIGKKFEKFIIDYFKAGKTTSELLHANLPDYKRVKLGRYLLAQTLIEDMVMFVDCCLRHCNQMLGQRIQHSELVAETKSTRDRIRLKTFDERCFFYLNSRMGDLKIFVGEFCTLFDSEWNVAKKDVAAVVAHATRKSAKNLLVC